MNRINALNDVRTYTNTKRKSRGALHMRECYFGVASSIAWISIDAQCGNNFMVLFVCMCDRFTSVKTNK